MKTLESLGDYIAAQKLELAAKNLKHLLKIQEEQASLENIVGSLQQTVIDAHANNPMDICDTMVVQTRILDAAFHKYVDHAGERNTYDSLEFAMKAQNQMLRTALAWKLLKTDTYIKRKIIHVSPVEEKTNGTN